MGQQLRKRLKRNRRDRRNKRVRARANQARNTASQAAPQPG